MTTQASRGGVYTRQPSKNYTEEMDFSLSESPRLFINKWKIRKLQEKFYNDTRSDSVKSNMDNTKEDLRIVEMPYIAINGGDD